MTKPALAQAGQGPNSDSLRTERFVIFDSVLVSIPDAGPDWFGFLTCVRNVQEEERN